MPRLDEGQIGWRLVFGLLGFVLGIVAIWPDGLCATTPAQALIEAKRFHEAGNPVEALAVLDRALAAFPEDPLLHFNRGVMLAEGERFNEAAEALRTGLELDVSHAEARLTLAKVLVSVARYQDALVEIDRYAALVGHMPLGFDGHYAHGLALRHSGRLPEAERELRLAVEIDPSHIDAWFNLGAVLADRDAYGEAVACLRKAAALDSGNPEIRYRLSRILRMAGDTAAADSELAKFQRLKSVERVEGAVSDLLRRAERSIEDGDPQRAKDLYQQAIRQDASNAEAHANLGVAYEQLGHGDLAEAMFRKALQLQPDFAGAHLNLGLKLAQHGRFEDALERLSEAARLEPDQIAARQGLAMVLTRLGRPLEAVPDFEFVVGERPGALDAHLNLGLALAEGGKKEQALEAFLAARRLAPKSVRAHYSLGRVLGNLGRAAEARTALEQAVALDPSFAPALQLLGTMHRNQGSDARAVELLTRAAESDPKNPLVHYDLGLAVAQAEGPEHAARHWERAVALDPSHKDALYNLARALGEADPARAKEYRDRFVSLKAMEQDTDRAGTLRKLALAEARRERWAEAFELFGRALEACGDCAAKGQIHKNFGLTLGQARDFERAETELLKAQRLLPDDRVTRQAIQLVQQAIAQGR